ncbi:hypothetical protein [Curtobacterium ammoniigenes]|uniref:hypothetical protein n=1 Tax=Curtobacterium ammoniigenes TaxID=395387 RepID=UPI00082CF087|nr:hypothetical protein [Curtobacterium ammoniigenes]
MNAGHATYALIDLVFLLAAAIVAIIAGGVSAQRARSVAPARARRWRRTALLTRLAAGSALVVMTVVFDNVIVGLRIVAYDPLLISGAHLGFIPVEDLAYSVAAVILLPSLAILFTRPTPDRAATPEGGHRP